VTIRRRQPGDGKREKRRNRTTRSDAEVSVTLPDKPSKPAKELSDFSWLIYGERKIGKTTLMSQFPDPFFLAFEPGHKALEVFFRLVDDWSEVWSYLDLLEADSRFKTVVVDVVDRAYRLCFNHVCGLNYVKHPNDDSQQWGKIWDAIGQEFDRFVNRLLRIGKGVVFLSHAELKQVTKRDGSSWDQLQPTLSGQPMKVVEGLVDIIAYYGYSEDGRELVIRGDQFVDAGCRPKEQFKTTDGTPVVVIPMGSSESEAYENLMSAFRCELEDAGETGYVAQKKRKQK
jgi:hypothetical protein